MRRISLTAQYCRTFNDAILAVEVCLGTRVWLDCFDFERSRGKLRFGGKIYDFCFTEHYGAHTWIQLDSFGLMGADFSDDGQYVEVFRTSGDKFFMTAHGGFSAKWVGTSFVDRQRKPMDPNEVRDRASALGITPEQLWIEKKF